MISVAHGERIVVFVYQQLFTQKSQNITIYVKFLPSYLDF